MACFVSNLNNVLFCCSFYKTLNGSPGETLIFCISEVYVTLMSNAISAAEMRYENANCAVVKSFRLSYLTCIKHYRNTTRL